MAARPSTAKWCGETVSLLALKSFSSVPVGVNGIISHVVAAYGSGGYPKNIDFYDQEILVEANKNVYRFNKETLALNSITNIAVTTTPSQVNGTTAVILNNGDMFCIGDYYSYRVTPAGVVTVIGKIAPTGTTWSTLSHRSKRLSNGDFLIACRYHPTSGNDYTCIFRMDQNLNILWSKIVQETYSTIGPNGEFCIELTDGTLCILSEYLYGGYQTASLTFLSANGTVLKNLMLYTTARAAPTVYAREMTLLPNGRLMVFLTNSAAGSSTSALVVDPVTYLLESIKTFNLRLNNAYTAIKSASVGNDGYLYLGTLDGCLIKCSLTLGGQINAVIWAKLITNTDSFDAVYQGYSIQVDGDFIYMRRAAGASKRLFFMKLPLNNIPNGTYAVGTGSVTISDAAVGAFGANEAHTLTISTPYTVPVTLLKTTNTGYSPQSVTTTNQAQLSL